MSYVLNKRYLIKQISNDGLIKTPQVGIPYSSGTENAFNEWTGYKTREEAYEVIKENTTQKNSNYNYSSRDYIILEVVSYDWEEE